MSGSPRVVAVVVTYNRKEMLVECLEALAAQTHPLAEVVLVDNASSDGTLERVEASGVADRLPLRYVRLRRNGGGAEGFHYGVRAALEAESDWLWLMDDDCEPGPETLVELLRSARAQLPETAVLAPVVEDDRGRVLPINRGHIRRRFFFAPLVAATPDEYASEETKVEFCSFVGPLVRTGVARRIGLPMREMFIRFEDVEYLSRLSERDEMWLVAGSRIVHKDPEPVAAANLRARWADYARRAPFAQSWKLLYGFRNQLWCGFRDGYVGLAQALSYALVQAVRMVLFHERRLKSLRLLCLYVRDARAGRFRNVPPARWAALGGERRVAAFVAREAMRYDEDVSERPRRLGSGAPV